MILVIFLAFDGVLHANLLEKLKSYGVFDQISSSLYKTALGCSGWEAFFSCPTFFLVCINDLHDVICDIAMYANDDLHDNVICDISVYVDDDLHDDIICDIAMYADEDLHDDVICDIAMYADDDLHDVVSDIDMNADDDLHDDVICVIAMYVLSVILLCMLMMIFMMMLSVILLCMLMTQLFTQSLLGFLICGNS